VFTVVLAKTASIR